MSSSSLIVIFILGCAAVRHYILCIFLIYILLYLNLIIAERFCFYFSENKHNTIISYIIMRYLYIKQYFQDSPYYV